MNPKVTVIIPSYNHARYLPMRIESILRQTYTDYELLVIDDCSPDNSDEIIQQYRDKKEFNYIRNTTNSGTPFSAWERGIFTAKGKYIWICESDDFAEDEFLERAVCALEADENNVLFYSNSYVVDQYGSTIGNTSSYFVDVWKTTRWEHSFVSDGRKELEEFQLVGQTVPNMSSCLIRQTAFCKAYTDYLKKFKLTGDWLFIGLVMLCGNVVFDPDMLSNFRKHEVTSRNRVKSARSQAEFILTKDYLYHACKSDDTGLLKLMSNDAVRFIYEDASASQVLTEMLRISVGQTFRLGCRMVVQLLKNKDYIKMFWERKKSARS